MIFIGHNSKQDNDKINTNDSDASDSHLNGMKSETTSETSEQRSLRNSGRSISAVSDELRTNSNSKSNQKLKSGNGNNSENTEQNGSRYNAMSDEEDYDEDEILTTSSEEQDNVSIDSNDK